MSCTVAILVTLDTKGEEARYVKDYIERRSHRVIVIDCGTLGQPLFTPDIGREKVIEAALGGSRDVDGLGDEGKAIEVMAKGASIIVQQMCREGKIDGIICIGGSMGTSLGLAVMKELPFGIPKLIVSTIAFSSYINPDSLSVDIVMMQSPADMWGLNSIINMTLGHAAAAITGMAELYQEKHKTGWKTQKPLIGVTTLGTAVLNFVPYLKGLLEDKGYEVAVFHVPGMDSLGVRALIELIQQGFVAGVLDLAQMDILNDVCQGLTPVSLRRIETTVEMGIPLVMAPGAAHSFVWTGPASTIPEQYQGRVVHQHNPLITGIKATHEEMVAAARLIIDRTNKAKGPVAIVIPKYGFSEWDKPGAFFHDPEGELLFIEEIKKSARTHVKIVEVDANINDQIFSDEVIRTLDGMMR
jgi:uncharacterized protein (UPF0261 family)